MHRNSGNFLLQTLLALTLVFALVPFVVSRLALRDTDAKMYSATRQAELAQTAARIYVRENAKSLVYGVSKITGENFVDVLEPYGLPLGFVPHNALGQNMALVVDKERDSLTAYLELSGGNVPGARLAELARRIGFYATATDSAVLVGLALEGTYSDVVHRNATFNDDIEFLTDLNMGGFSIENVGTAFSRRAEIAANEIGTLSVAGMENGRSARNSVKQLTADRAVFQSKTGEAALTVTKGTLNTKSVQARTISKYGVTGNLNVKDMAAYNFAMTTGHTGFTGPDKWSIHGNLIATNVTFSLDQLNVNSYINVARGQEVYVNAETLQSESQSGISTQDIVVSSITMRDQTSNALLRGYSSPVILDIRPAGTSILPDVLVTAVNNDDINIIKSPLKSANTTESCKEIISQTNVKYSKNSLSQYIICQYLFWVRLEQRIDKKQCILDGKSGC